MADGNYKYQFRLIMIGDSTVGKSSLLRQFKVGGFWQDISLTVGVDFHAKVIHVNGQPIKLQLWDTAGQDRFRAIVRAYYRNAVGGLLMFDITNRQSFANLTEWLLDARKNAEPHDLVFVLVGNKTDQEKIREVSRDEGVRFAQEHNMEYIETSAKTGSNVEEAFHLVSQKIYNFVEDGVIKIEDGWDGVKKGQPIPRGMSPVSSSGSRGAGVTLPSNQSNQPKKEGCCGKS